MSCAARPPISTAPARSAAWFRSAPRTSTTWCRPGERWGVDLSGSYGTNKDRGLASVFGGVRVDPNVDVFGGAVYRTQDNYKDGAGTEIGNTGNDIAAGLMKLTVRPADGHEIKFGAVFQDYQYTVGQFNRGPVLTAAQRALNQGSSVYDSDARNYTGTVTWKYSKPDDMLFDWNAKLYGNRTENDQTKTYHYSTSGAGYCGAGNAGNNISGCVGDRRGYRARYRRVRRQQHLALRCRRLAQRPDLRRRCVSGRRQDRRTARGNSNITTPERRSARSPAASCN